MFHVNGKCSSGRWAQIASTNPLERLNKEIKRRADVVGFAGAPTPGSLPNDAALVRLVGALMLEQSDEWAVSRRYFSLESLAKLDNTQSRRLAAVAG
jgi:transposase-like protein